MKPFILLALFLAGCIFDAEEKPTKTITIDCRNSYDHEDSTGSHFSCPVNDPKPTRP